MKHLKNDIEKAIEQKWITARKHPLADLTIYNYSQICQYDRIWTPITLQARGLILNADYSVHARPFCKFFNHSELQPNEIPNEPFEVYTKLDGSLGIIYWIDNVPYVATRGSFESDQAIKATEILHSKYQHTFDKLKRDRTYLFEILYPSNRIVIDYNGLEDLILLAIIDNETGKDLPLEDVGFPIVQKHDGINDIESLKALEKENEEGFVIKFKNGFRCKLKFQEYIRLHKILTQTSNIAIWECLKNGQPLDELLERIPDEFFRWVRQTKEDLEYQYKSIEEKSKITYDSIINGFKSEDLTRKAFALEVMRNYRDISGILFNMHDQREYKDIIWKMIRPTYGKPFREEI